ncbi:MAG: bifunctional proline dehydrogenase/L-glutamate gamma-semialdehyde dehydrogenase PutA [Alphaproteobacteria bacterium]|nr:bifunctional proline dehydrogenase/L-glutamate gamma-semialdehyde dehydrogenase PutA [Alphaproteobacteria bacterium]
MAAVDDTDLDDFEPFVRGLDAGPPRDEFAGYHLIDEGRLVAGLTERAVYTEAERRRTGEIARQLIHAARSSRHEYAGVDAFMREYDLSSEEGVILMCLAESLLRIPDSETADQLIAERISQGAWDRHLGHSDSMFVNASTWGLLLTGRIVKLNAPGKTAALDSLKRLVVRSGEPVIRQAMKQAVRLLGDQFVFGRTIQDALKRAHNYEKRGYLFSYDMLGESARTHADADRYATRYMDALMAIARSAGPLMTKHPDALMRRPGLSIKLSALHPRFEPGKEYRLASELMPTLTKLLRAACAQGIPVTLDAEEQDRMDLLAAVFAHAYMNPALNDWHGLGIAVQAYSKRAIPMLRWLRQLSERKGKRIPVRLVKGAYWDNEIKWAQERGLENYPVFTRKLHTDVSYLACVRMLQSDRKAFFPSYATHNAHTLAAAYVATGNHPYEFQRLHGMGEALYDAVVGPDKLGIPCRVYAPVGGHEDLLPYLVRRLLENGANTSFVNRLAHDDGPVSELVRDPILAVEQQRASGVNAITIPRPRDIFLPERQASAGLALSEPDVRNVLYTAMDEALAEPLVAGPIVSGEARIGPGGGEFQFLPHDRRQRLGKVTESTSEDIAGALKAAASYAHSWETTPATERAALLERTANLFERDRARLMALIIRESGKTLTAAHDEIREAVDFLRYYASEARRLFSGSVKLPSPTGETNTITLRGRGVFASICPWNFPVAIFTGQAAAAIAAGNPVIAKPAEQTPLTAFAAAELFIEAGIPAPVIQLLPGDGSVGEALVRDPRIAGVVFTGSTETAWAIQRTLAERRGPIVPFIAETAGLNAMIADSTSLPEQVVRDVVRSAFDSAGQRCSATRVLFLQDDIAQQTISMLAGAVTALEIGDPMDFATDIGPVIDEVSQDQLDGHKLAMNRTAFEIVDCPLPEACRNGSYVTPAAYEIESLDVLGREMFGPILHVIRYGNGRLGQVIEAINAKGYGLTLGLHSRILGVADFVAKNARVGNLYVNRNQVGAMVGVQPFGGEGLSGTGPKAGGPNYLIRFATERVRTTDITATGGNLDLLRAAVADPAAPETD